MISKTEALKNIVKSKGLCNLHSCKECPYSRLFWVDRRCRKLKVIGAMAILRMFPKRKTPILEVGTKIRLDNGKLYGIEKRVETYRDEYCLRDKNTWVCYPLDYLIGKTWEVVE